MSLSTRRQIKGVFAAIAGVLSLGACQEGPIVGHDALVSFSALNAAFVTDFAPFEAAANALRTGNARYTIQRMSAYFGSNPYKKSYSLDQTNVEYAHAAGLTGAGQIIAIIDNGFLQSHTEFTGKTIQTPAGFGPGVADHGTAVAAIAAGAAGSGSIIGVAPGADLALGSFNSYASMAAATDQARAIGAIVLNNSWGFEENIGSANYNSFFGSGTGKTYIDALKDYARDGVVVFAASNNNGRSVADIMAALPLLEPELEKSWIAAINVVPTATKASGKVKSASLLSSACHEAAAWCVGAPGVVYSATSSGNSAYQSWVGTSFAAPQVSGAIALLAEAFPTLDNTELRARLLASADNGWFSHDGFVNFAKGLRHGYSDTWGHGMIDLKAALMPIGTSRIRARGQSFDLGAPIIMGGGASGDALSRHLKSRRLRFADALGGGFDAQGAVIGGNVMRSGGVSLAALMAADLQAEGGDPLAPPSAFAGFDGGGAQSLALGDAQLDLLLPQAASAAPSYGLALSRRADLGAGALTLGLAAIREGQGFAGLDTTAAGEGLSGLHAQVQLGWTLPVARGGSLTLSGVAGLALPEGSAPFVTPGAAHYDSYRIAWGARELLRSGDRFSLGLGLPQAVTSGTAAMRLPMARAGGGRKIRSRDFSLVPQARQIDLSLSYGTPLARGADLLVSAMRSVNAGNFAGESEISAALGLRLDF